MAWTDAAQVRRRVKQATEANGWGDTEIGYQITRAEDELKSKFIPRYGSTEVAKWDTPATCPTIIDDLAADQTAAFIFLCAYGQDIHNPGTAGGALQKHVDETLEELFTHQTELVLSDGTVIKQIDTGLARIDSTTRQWQHGGKRDPVYTMGEKVSNPSEPGSLDAY